MSRSPGRVDELVGISTALALELEGRAITYGIPLEKMLTDMLGADWKSPDKVVSKYRAGYTLEEVSDLTGFSLPAIRKILQASGVTLRSPARSREVRRKLQLRLLIADGYDDKEIAEQTKYPVGYVRKIRVQQEAENVLDCDPIYQKEDKGETDDRTKIRPEYGSG